jgi:hypothetical protein
LTDLETGEKGFFSIPPKGYIFITVKPVQYQSRYVFWCDGKMRMKDRDGWAMPVNQFWTLTWKCRQGWPIIPQRQ